MISPNPETENSTQHLQNRSYDKDNEILAFELLGFDGSNLVRLATDSNGKLKIDPTALDARYLLLDQTTPQTISGGIPLLTGLTPTQDYEIITKKYVDDTFLQDTNDVIKDTHIDWGIGVNQVSADDIPDGSTNIIPTSTQESNWDTAYGWGDHAGLYLPVATVLPDNEGGAANNFLTAYNSTTGAWTKARPTWANIDKTTSDIADLTTKSHTSLSDIGTNTHAQIDTFIGTTVPTDYALKGQTFYIGTTQVAINRASAALTLEGLTLTTPNIGEATGDSITLTTTAATRENIFTASVSDAGNDKFGIGNATTVASRFIPNIYGYVESVNSLQSFGFSGMVKDTNDASSSSTNGIIDFRVTRTDNATNPEAGTFSAIQNRNLYTFRNATTVLWTIPAGGHLYSGTDGTGLYDIKTGGNITSIGGDVSAGTAKLSDLTDGYLPYHIADATGLGNSSISTDGTNVTIAGNVDIANNNFIFGSNDDLTMTVTQHTSAPALNLYPAGGSLTSSRFAFRCVEGTSNFARFQGCTGTTAALASSNTMGIVEFAITQADPNPLKGVINFWTNSGDSIAVKATLNETGVFNAVGGFSDNGSAGIDTTFVDNDGNTITVKGGIITSKVAP